MEGRTVGTNAVAGRSETARPWPRELLEGFALPEEVAALLFEQGLPVDPAPSLVRFLDRPLEVPSAVSARYLAVGIDEEGLLLLREGSGEVVAWTPWPRTPRLLFEKPHLAPQAVRERVPVELNRLVNASLVGLLACLRHYQSRLEEFRRVDEEGALHVAEDLRDAIRTVDHGALADRSTWWSRVIARAEDGLC